MYDDLKGVASTAPCLVVSIKKREQVFHVGVVKDSLSLQVPCWVDGKSRYHIRDWYDLPKFLMDEGIAPFCETIYVSWMRGQQLALVENQVL